MLVEDDAGDALMTREAFELSGLDTNLSVVSDGAAALEFLRRQGTFADAPAPDLILLDLNLPRVSGREVLAEIRADALLVHIPVVVLTTSDAPEDVLGSYRLHANAYVTKPVDFDRFTRAIQSIDEFFTGLVRLPRPELGTG